MKDMKHDMCENCEEHGKEGGEHVCALCRMKEACSGHGMCSRCGGYNHFSLLRVLLGLFIVAVVFWCGTSFGAAACEMGGYSGYGNDYGYNNGYRHGGRMMYQYATPNTDEYAIPGGTVPAKPMPAATPTKR